MILLVSILLLVFVYSLCTILFCAPKKPMRGIVWPYDMKYYVGVFIVITFFNILCVLLVCDREMLEQIYIYIGLVVFALFLLFIILSPTLK